MYQLGIRPQINIVLSCLVLPCPSVKLENECCARCLSCHLFLLLLFFLFCLSKGVHSTCQAPHRDQGGMALYYAYPLGIVINPDILTAY